MRVRVALFAAVVVTVLAASGPAGASTGDGAGPMTVSGGGDRYGGGATYSMIGPFVVGTDAYTGPFSLTESWSALGLSAASIQGSAAGHSLSGSCTTSDNGPVFGNGTFTCAVDLDGNQDTVTLSLTSEEVTSTQTGPGSGDWTAAGAYAVS